ncbi:MAG: Cof-type HAD-IIB family hydrolase [Verrucomicrobiales bacterium]|jgi:HAD superfamily hydrolase (TIGR01484 family)|nr:Cof-type HAD-IIB family hydrolase [Verrucomicrobiales bacterium]
MNQPAPVLISTDFDGTLILDYNSPSLAPRFFAYLARLRQQRRVVWVINTGREWESLGEILASKSLPFFPDWMALLEREIYRIKDRELVALEHWNKRSDSQHDDLFKRAGSALDKLRHHVEQSDYAEVISDTGSPFGICAKTDAHADQIAEEAYSLLADFPEIMLVRNSVYARFAHINFHKGSCLEAIAKEENISKDNIFAIGDHLNDLQMLNPRYATHIACPANSTETVKQAVREHGGYVANGEAADGVVEALEHFFGK